MELVVSTMLKNT